jgi:uncharacterized membrane protein YGL010W
MARDSKLMEMLTGYAAAHRHPWNVAVHMVGIPVIMFGVLVPLTWVSFDIAGFAINLAHLAVFGMFLFYVTLERLFAVVFLLFAMAVAWLAGYVGREPLAVSGGIAAAAFVGGYLAQFIGHAIEKSPPVILKHPIQANLAAPFFTVVEAFHLLGLRDELFERVQRRIAGNRPA